MYEPGNPPASLSLEEQEYILNELRKIAEAFKIGEFSSITLQELNVEPDKPRDGDLINADGTNFDPGSGKGVYFHDGTNYNKL